MTKSSNVILESVVCPLGCKKNDEIILTGRDLLHGLPGEFNVVKCGACNLMRTNPRVNPESIGYYYPDDYGPYIQTKVESQKSNRDNFIIKFLRPIARHLFNSNVTVLPKIAVGRMLEIGCASGSFMHKMAKLGWQVQGIEFDEKAAKAAKKHGYHVHCGPLETAPTPTAPFDLVVGWMVLEHLYDPIGGLIKLRQWAKPNAWLVLSVPNAGSLEFKLFKDKWYALQLPTHFHHFTPATLKTVLSASGWKLEKVHHQRVLNNLFVSTGYVLRDKGYSNIGQSLIDFPAHAGRLTYVLYPLAWLLSVFGQTGRMTIWASVSTNLKCD